MVLAVDLVARSLETWVRLLVKHFFHFWPPGLFQGRLESTARHLMEIGYQQQLTYKLVNFSSKRVAHHLGIPGVQRIILVWIRIPDLLCDTFVKRTHSRRSPVCVSVLQSRGWTALNYTQARRTLNHQCHRKKIINDLLTKSVKVTSWTYHKWEGNLAS